MLQNLKFTRVEFHVERQAVDTQLSRADTAEYKINILLNNKNASKIQISFLHYRYIYWSIINGRKVSVIFGGASIAIEISKSIKPRKFGYHVCPSLRPSVRTHGLGLGTSLCLSLIWSPSYAKSDTKTYSVRSFAALFRLALLFSGQMLFFLNINDIHIDVAFLRD